jgi:hypothetical protein
MAFPDSAGQQNANRARLAGDKRNARIYKDFAAIG